MFTIRIEASFSTQMHTNTHLLLFQYNLVLHKVITYNPKHFETQFIFNLQKNNTIWYAPRLAFAGSKLLLV